MNLELNEDMSIENLRRDKCILIMKSKFKEPEDAREVFHKSEKRQVVKDKIRKYFFYVCILVTMLIFFFAVYSYFIDKPEPMYNEYSVHP